MGNIERVLTCITVVINAREWNSTFFRGLKYVNRGLEGARETALMAGALLLLAPAGQGCSGRV